MLINELTKQSTNTSGLLTMTLKDNLGASKTYNSSTSFKDVFGGAVNNEKTKSTSENSQSKGNDLLNKGYSNNTQIHSYKDLQRSIRNEVRKNIVQSGKSATNSREGDEEKKVDEENGVDKEAYNEAIVNCFANLTGLKPEEFKAVLEKAGVSVEELANLNNMAGITEKIASATNLSSEQEDTLAKLMS